MGWSPQYSLLWGKESIQGIEHVLGQGRQINGKQKSMGSLLDRRGQASTGCSCTVLSSKPLPHALQDFEYDPNPASVHTCSHAP